MIFSTNLKITSLYRECNPIFLPPKKNDRGTSVIILRSGKTFERELREQGPERQHPAIAKRGCSFGSAILRSKD